LGKPIAQVYILSVYSCGPKQVISPPACLRLRSAENTGWRPARANGYYSRTALMKTMAGEHPAPCAAQPRQRSTAVTLSSPAASVVKWHAEPGAVLPSNGLDRNCIERAKAHDEEAARTLVQEFYPLVIKIVRSHRPRRMDEDELVQIIFVKVFQKLDQWAGEA